MNPYESPELNVDCACYDHTLFWLVVRVLLVIGAVLIAVDIGWGMLAFGAHRSCAIDFSKAVLDMRWDELRELLGL